VHRHRQRKVLLASIGVAAVSYVACSGDDTSPGIEAGANGGGGGFVADAGASGSRAADAIVEHASPDFDVLVANLMVSPMSR